MFGEIVFWSLLAVAFCWAVTSSGTQRSRSPKSRTTSLAFASGRKTPLLERDDKALDLRLDRVLTSKHRLPSRLHAVLPHLPPVSLSEDQWEELVRIAYEDPREALRRIDRLPAADRRNPRVRIARIYALGNIIWGSGESDPDRDDQAFLRLLPPELKRFAEEGVKEIAALEADEPNFLSLNKDDTLANRVCMPFEFHRPGGVQRMLGWTKVGYWIYPENRYFVLDENDPDTEDLKDLPTNAWGKIIFTRFSCPQTALSSVLAAARTTPQGWMALFILGARQGGSGQRIRDIEPFGMLTIREDGAWRFDAAPDSRAMAPDRHGSLRAHFQTNVG